MKKIIGATMIVGAIGLIWYFYKRTPKLSGQKINPYDYSGIPQLTKEEKDNIESLAWNTQNLMKNPNALTNHALNPVEVQNAILNNEQAMTDIRASFGIQTQEDENPDSAFYQTPDGQWHYEFKL